MNSQDLKAFPWKKYSLIEILDLMSCLSNVQRVLAPLLIQIKFDDLKELVATGPSSIQRWQKPLKAVLKRTPQSELKLLGFFRDKGHIAEWLLEYRLESLALVALMYDREFTVSLAAKNNLLNLSVGIALKACDLISPNITERQLNSAIRSIRISACIRNNSDCVLSIWNLINKRLNIFSTCFSCQLHRFCGDSNAGERLYVWNHFLKYYPFGKQILDFVIRNILKNLEYQHSHLQNFFYRSSQLAKFVLLLLKPENVQIHGVLLRLLREILTHERIDKVKKIIQIFGRHIESHNLNYLGRLIVDGFLQITKNLSTEEATSIHQELIDSFFFKLLSQFRVDGFQETLEVFKQWTFVFTRFPKQAAGLAELLMDNFQRNPWILINRKEARDFLASMNLPRKAVKLAEVLLERRFSPYANSKESYATFKLAIIIIEEHGHRIEDQWIVKELIRYVMAYSIKFDCHQERGSQNWRHDLISFANRWPISCETLAKLIENLTIANRSELLQIRKLLNYYFDSNALLEVMPEIRPARSYETVILNTMIITILVVMLTHFLKYLFL